MISQSLSSNQLTVIVYNGDNSFLDLAKLSTAVTLSKFDSEALVTLLLLQNQSKHEDNNKNIDHNNPWLYSQRIQLVLFQYKAIVLRARKICFKTIRNMCTIQYHSLCRTKRTLTISTTGQNYGAQLSSCFIYLHSVNSLNQSQQSVTLWQINETQFTTMMIEQNARQYHTTTIPHYHNQYNNVYMIQL